ncbi:MAG: M48 family metallopeptidase [Gammaproteobacteria bacterium]|nr:M48 family metallopeptidase [Gammaproteobacteria bacterium]
MNFFAVQDQARRSSRRLVTLYLLATALIVVGVSLVAGAVLYDPYLSGQPFSLAEFVNVQARTMIGTAIITTLFIAGATLYKTATLSSGGSHVAQQVGGTLVSPATTDPLRSRLRNVVEEMAIASGVPVPEIYVLERENGINAFAAGFAPGDAAVAVTRGALELLDRDELQGVIGHEFSHILNGDMRLNIRLMGVLFGIMSIGLMGRMLLRGLRYSGSGSRRGKGVPVVLLLGLGLSILGAVGVFFARVIKAGVSRQREYLADASSVQFTRQSSGLANALKKIGGFAAGSLIRSTDPEEVSHMLFGTGSRLRGLFATHPPLTERIRALDPSFRETDYPHVSMRDRDNITIAAQDAEPAAFAAAPSRSGISTKSISDSVGRPTEQHVAFAAQVRQDLPDVLYDAAHSAELSYLLVIALMLDRSGRVLQRQLALNTERLGEQRARLVRQYFDKLQNLAPEYRLPLLEIAFPSLRRRPAPQLAYLIELAQRLIEMDGVIDLHEYCVYRVLTGNLRHSIDPSHQRRTLRVNRTVVRNAAVELLRLVAHHGHGNDRDGEAAFHAGLSVFGSWGESCEYAADHELSVTQLDQNLDQLIALNGAGRQMLLDAVTQVVVHDGQLAVAEAELVRAICASLEIPLPPQIGVSWNSAPESGSNKYA